MGNEHWAVGQISITKVEENQDSTQPVETLLHVLPGSSREQVDAIDWLRPDYLLENGDVGVVVHSLLVETPTHRIVIDTGVGNGKQRLSPLFDHLQGDFMERFEQVWPRGDVDGVICTHLHVDHVGWNTVPAGDGWVPTFPNARYYFVRDEYEYWREFAADPDAPRRYASEVIYSYVDGQAVFEDSVRPVEEAGLVTWVKPGQTIVPGISLVGTAGHTPGHVSVLIEDAGQSAVVTGDLLHSPIQVARPQWSPALDTDSATSGSTRRSFLERFADSPTLVLGTHFGTPTGSHIVRDGDNYKLVPERG